MTSANVFGRATWAAGWERVDAALRRNASARTVLDAEEMELLREAERMQIWRPLGMVSMIDYMDRVLGHPPETARKRLRVARALGELPTLSAALAAGSLTFSSVRELTRVATRATEAEWCDTATGKSSREIEELVAGHRPGDLPEDPRDADATTHVVRFEVTGATFARLRQARVELAEERGESLDDDAFVALLCDCVTATSPESHAEEGPGCDRTTVSSRSEPHREAITGRARWQLSLTICDRCDRGWQTGGGRQIPVDAATIERARCDAQHIGPLDASSPARAHQDIPPATARLVWARDGARCQTPGCRSARGLELHHIIHRSAGGSHDPSNLTLRCSACHRAHHEGSITIAGTAPHALTLTRNVSPSRRTAPRSPRTVAAHHRPSRPLSGRGGGPTAYEHTALRTQARDALVALGWRSAIATAAVDEALGHVAHPIAVDSLIRESLRRCPRPH